VPTYTPTPPPQINHRFHLVVVCTPSACSHYLTENLLCLMSNASKYSDRGATIDVRLELVDPSSISSTDAPTKSASVGSAPPGIDTSAHGHPTKVVVVTVEDNGIGITDENQRKLFQPFKQAQRSAGGTGLGLFSLAKRIEALEGTCGVRNRADGKQGSAFWFTFPYRPDVAAHEEHEETVNGKRTNSSGNPTQRSGGNGTPGRALPQLRILLTDDSPAILKVTTRFLEKAGHIVETADNGNQSLERLKVARDKFDVLITDLQVLMLSLFLSLSLSHSLSIFLSLSFSFSHSHSLSFFHSHSLSLSLTHTFSLTFSLFLSLSSLSRARSLPSLV
jgi:CheY-like chemotaxis protein